MDQDTTPQPVIPARSEQVGDTVDALTAGATAVAEDRSGIVGTLSDLKDSMVNVAGKKDAVFAKLTDVAPTTTDVKQAARSPRTMVVVGTVITTLVALLTRRRMQRRSRLAAVTRRFR